MDTSKPQPERFLVYNLLPDGKGFTIKGCKFVFKLDRHGGWRDQYGHYYNANGQPDFEPQDAELTPSEGSIHSDDYANDYDEFEPTYDDVEDQQEEHYTSYELRNMERISRNMQTLSAYPADKILRVYFSNMPFKAPPKSVYEAYSKKVSGIVNIIFDTQQNRRNGEGHFIMEDCKKAQILVKLQGQKVLEREVHFEVEKLNELIMDPIKQADTIPFWNTKAGPYVNKKGQIKQQKKDDVPKFKAAPLEQKKEEKKQQKKVYLAKTSQQKPAQKSQPKPEPKLQQKLQPKSQPQPQPQFKHYTLNFEIFPSKTRFWNWITQNKGDKDKDIKNISKEQKDGKTTIIIQIRTKLVELLKGKQYDGKKVIFNVVGGVGDGK